MTEQVIFDVSVDAINAGTKTVTFTTVEGGQIVRRYDAGPYWKVGDVGVLHLDEQGADFRFHAYPDNRLRRVPAQDEPADGLWGWRLEGVDDEFYSIKAGVIPGKDCSIIVDDSEVISLKVPREFLDLCQTHELRPDAFLQSFIADLCELQNFMVRPREDGLSSHGSDERALANEWFERAYGHLLTR
ncbi:hypothetical protein [Niveibacterium sp.]|uniref:hypothetical protein n=1 Tax=Niveibacterium sp. TaxID=2017444 RepID=UPI0035B0F502